MTFESIRGYLQLASGLVEVTRAKATEAAMSLLTLPSTISGGTLSAQAQDLAEELMAAAAANRSNLIALVRSEVEKAVAKASVMSLDELDRARAGMAKLSSDVEELRDEVLRRPAVRAVPGVSEMSAMLGVRPGSPPANGPTGGAVVSASSPLALSPLAETIPTVASVLPPPAKNPRKARATRRTQPVVASSASESVVTRSPATAHSPVKTATKAAATKAPTTKASTTKAPTTKAAATKARTTKARPRRRRPRRRRPRRRRPRGRRPRRRQPRRRPPQRRRRHRGRTQRKRQQRER